MNRKSPRLSNKEKEDKGKTAIDDGAEAQNRTADTRLFRPLLYQLSYLGLS